MTRVSVIIPNLNDTKYLEQLVSQLNDFRPRQGWEVIVVDGGSSNFPGTIEDKVDQLLVSDPGRATQLNAGIACSKGHLIWLLHADSGINVNVCRAMDALSRDLNMEQESRWGRFNVVFSSTGKRYSMLAFFMNRRSCITGICTGDQGVFVHRALLDKIGGVPEQKLMEDIELSRRLKIFSRPQCRREYVHTSARRWQKSGFLRTITLMWAMRAAYYFGVSPNKLSTIYYRSPT